MGETCRIYLVAKKENKRLSNFYRTNWEMPGTKEYVLWF